MSNLFLVVQKQKQIAANEPIADAPFGAAGSDYIDVPLTTGAFGPLPTAFGVATENSVIRVQTEALEGTIDCGVYTA